MLVISGSYMISLALSVPFYPLPHWTISPLNPAIALAEMTFTTFSGNIKLMNFAWIFLVLPWGGALLAVLVFELVFKRASNVA